MAGYIGSKASVTQVDGYNTTEADAEFVNDPNDVITVDGGNVGIGTSSPNAILTTQAGGALTLDSNDADHSGFGLLVSQPSSRATDTVNAAIGFASDSGRKYAAIGAQTYGDLDQTGLNFYVQGSASGSTASMSEAMRIDASGRVTKPYQPFFKAWDSTGTHWQSATIIPNQVAHNVGNHYSNTTGRFTCPIAGVYIFRTDWRCLGGQTNGTYMDIIASDGQIVRHEEVANDVNIYHQSIFAMFKLAANDYVYIRSGGAGGIRWDTNATDSFSGYLVG